MGRFTFTLKSNILWKIQASLLRIRLGGSSFFSAGIMSVMARWLPAHRHAVFWQAITCTVCTIKLCILAVYLYIDKKNSFIVTFGCMKSREEESLNISKLETVPKTVKENVTVIIELRELLK